MTTYEHNGTPISFDAHTAMFRAVINGRWVVAPSLTGIKIKLDRIKPFSGFVALVESDAAASVPRHGELVAEIGRFSLHRLGCVGIDYSYRCFIFEGDVRRYADAVLPYTHEAVERWKAYQFFRLQQSRELERLNSECNLLKLAVPHLDESIYFPGHPAPR